MFKKSLLLVSLIAMAAFAASPIPTEMAVAVICFPAPPSCYGCHNNPPYPCQDELKAVQKYIVHAAITIPAPLKPLAMPASVAQELMPWAKPEVTKTAQIDRKSLAAVMALIGGKAVVGCRCAGIYYCCTPEVGPTECWESGCDGFASSTEAKRSEKLMASTAPSCKR